MSKIPFINPEIVYREDFDDWSVLFNPDNAETYGLDETGSFIWKHIDGKYSLAEIARLMSDEFDGVPENALDEIGKFVSRLETKGLIGYAKI